MTPIALAILGLSGLVCGTLAFRAIRRSATDGADCAVTRSRKIALKVGAGLGLASWPLTILMSYPYADDMGSVGRVAGVPFFVAYFDAKGFDYVGPLTMPAVVLNAVFWFLLPQIVMYVAFSRRLRRRAT
jgi:hypothetical protein